VCGVEAIGVRTGAMTVATAAMTAETDAKRIVDSISY
jgi:hypothetical protein